MLSNVSDFYLQEKIDINLLTDESLLCINKDVLKKNVSNFINFFPGCTLYAVKCNPHPLILKSLMEFGIAHFDTASLSEIELIKSINPKAKCYFNHPIKTRRSIRSAYYMYGVRDYVIDSKEEFNKLDDEIDVSTTTIQLRLNVDTGSKIYDFSKKFGMTEEDILDFLSDLRNRDLKWALSFHVGSQCEDPSFFIKALKSCHNIIQKTGFSPSYINVGGGFPGFYLNKKIPTIFEYINLIQIFRDEYNIPPLLCEPGRALVYDSCYLIAQVILRKNNKLYINDGVYGSLGECNYAKIQLKVTGLSLNNNLSTNKQDFYLYGPTCDSFDVINDSVQLPNNINEGDWIIIHDLGAYSTSLTTSFNGFISNRVHLL